MTGAVLLLLACQDLTPGEYVLGDEIPAQIVQGPDGFGASVATLADSRIVSQPVRMGLQGEALRSVDVDQVRRVGLTDDGPWVWLSEGAVLFGPTLTERIVLTQASAIDRCPSGEFVSVTGAGEAVSCAESGVLQTRCSSGQCTVHIDDGPSLDRVSPGGDVAWVSGVACWGDPELEEELGAGRVTCEDGRELVGLTGDHLGLTIGGGRTAGRFNRHIVPPRLRIESLDGQPVWLIDRAAENSRVSLDASAGETLVGVAHFRQGGATGRVFVVSDAD